MRKLFWTLITLLVGLLVTIVILANSSLVIKQVADIFAPEYKISYEDIHGNILTGVKIEGLKYDNQSLAKRITFAWNPAKILYQRIAINTIDIASLNVDVLKALIASFPATEEPQPERNETTPFPLVVLVKNFSLSLDPFIEQGVDTQSVTLGIKDLRFAADGLDIHHIALDATTNITTLALEATLLDHQLKIDRLDIMDIDTVAVERLVSTAQEQNQTEEVAVDETAPEPSKEQTPSPYIPYGVNVQKLRLTLLPRTYQTARLENFELGIHALKADIAKLLANQPDALDIARYTLETKSNLLSLDVEGALAQETVVLNRVDIKGIDPMGIQKLLPKENNASKAQVSETKVAAKDTEEVTPTQPNQLIPKMLRLEHLHADIVPVEYDPVKIRYMALDINALVVDLQKQLAKQGTISLLGQSNLSMISHQSRIHDNTLIGDMKITPNKRLFELYELPLRPESIGDIQVDLNASQKHIVVDISAKAKNIFMPQKIEGEGNQSAPLRIDIDHLASHISYALPTAALDAKSKVVISTPYAKAIEVNNHFTMQEALHYSGDIVVDRVIGIDANLTQPLQDLRVHYDGNISSVKTKLTSKGLQGTFVSPDFKQGDLHLESKGALHLDHMVALPAKLEGAKASFEIDAPLNFAQITPLHATAKVRSNLANIDAEIGYAKRMELNLTSQIPQDSLLKGLDPHLQWQKLSPLVIQGSLADQKATLFMNSDALLAQLTYGLDDGKVDGKIGIASIFTHIQGSSKEKIMVSTEIKDLEQTLDAMHALYTVEGLPKVEGSLFLSLDVLNLEKVDLTLYSPELIYHTGRDSVQPLKNVQLSLGADPSQVVLKSYHVVYDEMELFATKPSQVRKEEQSIQIDELWLNDQLKVSGLYNLALQKGEIVADAKKLHIGHKIIDLDSALHIKTALEVNSTDIQGKIELLGGDIHYDMSTKSFPSDSDIVMVRDMKQKQASPFMDNLTTLIEVKSKKPLLYKQGPVDIGAMVDLIISKEKRSELMVLGEVVLPKGGSYTFEGKKFVLGESHIYFTGNPNKPMLDISVNYQSLNYLITIGVTGTPSAPNITFSSVPSLTREQILSIILFDSEEGAGTNTGEDMMKMMGGAMAKSALNDLGIKLDHLAIGTDGSIEVGKKITKRITFIYVNDTLPKVKVKYQHSPRIESVITADEESQSYDIVYKRDFSSEDIQILGR